MLVNNFSAGIPGIPGMPLAVLAFFAIGPLVEGLSHLLVVGVNLMVKNGLLPLTSIFVEPAKILFLNNAINHGIFSPLGIQQASAEGKSIFFLIEANPGPGPGVLLAYMFFGRGNAKQSASGAAIIHFPGGYPRDLPPVCPDESTSDYRGNFGRYEQRIYAVSTARWSLVSPASPGSILTVLAMTPKGAYFANMAVIAVAFMVYFVISAVLLKTSQVKEGEGIETATRRVQEMKAHTKGESVAATNVREADLSQVRKIIVACDAGMGFSAMGAGVLRK